MTMGQLKAFGVTGTRSARKSPSRSSDGSRNFAAHVMHPDQAVEDPRLVGIEELRLNLGHLRGDRCGGRSELVSGDVAGGEQRGQLILAGT
jgi:hypothetical protein